MKKQETAFKLGFKVGDFVFSGAFPGIIISDVRSFTPCLEVWGYEQECGSAYARDLIRIDPLVFIAQVRSLGHLWPVQPYSKAAQKAVAALI